MGAQTIKHSTTTAFHIVSGLTELVFGRRFFSVRAILVSFLISLLSLAVSIYIACVTTPTLTVHSIFSQPFNVVLHTPELAAIFKSLNSPAPADPNRDAAASQQKIPMGTVYDDPTILAEAVTLVLSLCFEYLYVSKSRYIVSFIRLNTRLRSIVSLLLADVVSTVAFFIVANMLILYILSIIIVLIPEPGKNADFMWLTVTNFTPGDPPLWESGDFSQLQFREGIIEFITPILEFLKYGLKLFWLELSSHLNDLLRLHIEISKVIYTNYGSQGGYELHFLRNYKISYPFSILMSSAILTTIWVILSACTLILSRVLCRIDRTSEAFIVYLIRNPPITLRLITWIVVLTFVYLLISFFIGTA